MTPWEELQGDWRGDGGRALHRALNYLGSRRMDAVMLLSPSGIARLYVEDMLRLQMHKERR